MAWSTKGASSFLQRMPSTRRRWRRHSVPLRLVRRRQQQQQQRYHAPWRSSPAVREREVATTTTKEELETMKLERQHQLLLQSPPWPRQVQPDSPSHQTKVRRASPEHRSPLPSYPPPRCAAGSPKKPPRASREDCPVSRERTFLSAPAPPAGFAVSAQSPRQAGTARCAPSEPPASQAPRAIASAFEVARAIHPPPPPPPPQQQPSSPMVATRMTAPGLAQGSSCRTVPRRSRSSPERAAAAPPSCLAPCPA
mmetsp:Transcript_2136/g.5254  ORF Transcript_2136/g.5254 Transcript_2136/m.5254 type:complete len:253 (+) Transcript_2136:240-998(+)